MSQIIDIDFMLLALDLFPGAIHIALKAMTLARIVFEGIPNIKKLEIIMINFEQIC